MNELPPLMRDQRKSDADHLRLLAIFHFVFAGLGLLALGFLFLHYSLIHHFLDNPEMWKHPKGGGPPPAEFFAVATEAFFERGPDLSAHHARLYETLRDYYQVDPASWPQPAGH